MGKSTGGIMDVINQIKNEKPLRQDDDIDNTYLDKDQRELLQNIK